MSEPKDKEIGVLKITEWKNGFNQPPVEHWLRLRDVKGVNLTGHAQLDAVAMKESDYLKLIELEGEE